MHCMGVSRRAAAPRLQSGVEGECVCAPLLTWSLLGTYPNPRHWGTEPHYAPAAYSAAYANGAPPPGAMGPPPRAGAGAGSGRSPALPPEYLPPEAAAAPAAAAAAAAPAAAAAATPAAAPGEAGAARDGGGGAALPPTGPGAGRAGAGAAQACGGPTAGSVAVGIASGCLDSGTCMRFPVRAAPWQSMQAAAPSGGAGMRQGLLDISVCRLVVPPGHRCKPSRPVQAAAQRRSPARFRLRRMGKGGPVQAHAYDACMCSKHGTAMRLPAAPAPSGPRRARPRAQGRARAAAATRRRRRGARWAPTARRMPRAGRRRSRASRARAGRHPAAPPRHAAAALPHPTLP